VERERERERERGREARKKFPGRVGIAVFKLSKCSQKEKFIFLNFKWSDFRGVPPSPEVKKKKEKEWKSADFFPFFFLFFCSVY
jgi:hypothetical protein